MLRTKDAVTRALAFILLLAVAPPLTFGGKALTVNGNGLVAYQTITFVAAGTTAVASGSPTSPSPGLPAGWAVNDVFIAQVVSSGTFSSNFTFGTITTPATWTLLTGPSDNENANYGLVSRIYWHRAVVADVAPVFVTTGLTPYGWARMVAYRGAVATGSPFEATGTVAINTASTTSTASAVTTTTPGAQVVALNALGFSATGITTPGCSAYTGTPTPTWRVYATGGANDCGAGIVCNAGCFADFTSIAAGTTGARSATIASVPNNAVLLALAPAVL